MFNRKRIKAIEGALGKSKRFGFFTLNSVGYGNRISRVEQKLDTLIEHLNLEEVRRPAKTYLRKSKTK